MDHRMNEWMNENRKFKLKLLPGHQKTRNVKAPELWSTKGMA